MASVRYGDGSRDLMTAMLAGKELLSSTNIADLGDRISFYLLPLFKAQGCYFGQLNDGAFDLWNPIVCTGACAENRELYSEYYCKVDPLVRAPYSPYTQSVYVTDDVVADKDEYEQSEFYNEFLKPRSIRSHLFVNLNVSARFVATLVLTRDGRSPRFGDLDKRLAALLEPYLSASLEKVLHMDENLEKESILKAVLEEVSARGIIVLDRSLRPVYHNRKSEAVLSMLYQPDEIREGFPRSLKWELENRITEIKKLPRESSSIPLARTFEIAPRGKEPRIRVSVRPTGRTDTSHFLVFLELEDIGLSFSKRIEQSRLTDRELEIVWCICEGMRNGQIAQKLCISNHTVTNHINHIFRKLGITSRTGLCLLVLGRNDSFLLPQPRLGSP